MPITENIHICLVLFADDFVVLAILLSDVAVIFLITDLRRQFALFILNKMLGY